MDQVVEVPFPLDVYAVALEEFLLIEALARLLQQQGHGALPPAIGLVPANDILMYAQSLLDASATICGGAISMWWMPICRSLHPFLVRSCWLLRRWPEPF
eukprot:s2780_g3.t1